MKKQYVIKNLKNGKYQKDYNAGRMLYTTNLIDAEKFDESWVKSTRKQFPHDLGLEKNEAFVEVKMTVGKKTASIKEVGVVRLERKL